MSMLQRVVTNLNRAITSPDMQIPSFKRTENNSKVAETILSEFTPTIETEYEDEIRLENNYNNQDDLIQENKYLREELTLLCQRIIELEEIEKNFNNSGETIPLSSCDSIESNGKIGKAMFQIQKLEEDLHRERMFTRELSRRIETQERSIIEKEDAIISLEAVIEKLLSDLEVFQHSNQMLKSDILELQVKSATHSQRGNILTSAVEQVVHMEELLHENQIELGNLVESKQRLHSHIDELEDMIHSRDEQLLELLRQLNEYEEAVLKLESIIHDANSKIMALDKKCDSQAKEIKRINSYKIENSVHFIPSIGSTGSTPLNCNGHLENRRPVELQIPNRPFSSSNLDSIGCSPIPLFPWMKEN